jgi:hypothetical protein
MKNRTLYVMGHLDLGDSIVMNGLIRNLLERWGAVSWFVKPEYVGAVASMMSDCERLKVLPAERGYEDPAASWIPSYLHTLRLGFFHKGTFDQLHWDYEFYRQAGVNFDCRWSDFYHAQVPPSCNAWPSKLEPKAIIHERAENDWKINLAHLPDHLEIIEIKKAESISSSNVPPPFSSPWQWIPELFSATEIHVIDSAFLCLADSLDLPQETKRVFHSYSKQYPGVARWPALGKKWEIIS